MICDWLMSIPRLHSYYKQVMNQRLQKAYSALNNLPHCYAQAAHKYFTNPPSRLLKLIFVVGEFEALKRAINKHRMRRVAKFNSSMWILIPITRAGVFLSHNDVCTVTIEVTFFGQIFLKLFFWMSPTR